MLVDGTAPTATAQKQYRAIICLENWEMPGEFNSCRGIDQTAEKKSAKNLVRENCPMLTSSLGLY